MKKPPTNLVGSGCGECRRYCLSTSKSGSYRIISAAAGVCSCSGRRWRGNFCLKIWCFVPDQFGYVGQRNPNIIAVHRQEENHGKRKGNER